VVVDTYKTPEKYNPELGATVKLAQAPRYRVDTSLDLSTTTFLAFIVVRAECPVP
jgi:hypothetical protein